MPYIKQRDRAVLDDSIYRLIGCLVDQNPSLVDRQGATNYVISRIVAGAMRPTDGWSYYSISRAIATLRDAATEMERRLMASHEDRAIERNGDLPEYTP